MLEINININRREDLVNIHCERKRPIKPVIENGEICEYHFFIDREFAGVIKHPYGNWLGLTKAMFDKFIEITDGDEEPKDNDVK